MARQKHKSQFPDTLIVRYDPQDEGEGYFIADRDARSFAEPNGRIRVGVYVLDRIADVTADVTLDDPQ